ncbi:MAG: sulfatase [Bacteroidota bacterium]
MLLLPSFLLASNKEKETAKPNVLFIIADDLGYYDLSCTGSEYYETPHIDRLAGESMAFEHGYSTAPVCSPARASIMNGQFAPRHGITEWIGARSGEEWRKQGRHNQLLPPEYKHNLSSEDYTWAEAMRDAGYKTFFSGKWHLGSEGSWPEDHGFDINVGGWHSGSPIGGYFDPYDNPNLKNRQPGENLSMRLADETVDFLNRHNPNETGQPVFAFLSFYAVHGPIQTTHKKWQKYRDKAEKMGIAESGFMMDKYLPIRLFQDNPVYAGLVEAMDDAVGHVLNGLDELGLDDNTIIIFTSDHGGVSSGDAFATSNFPFRRGKGSTFEGGLRVPFFVKVPGLTASNSTSDTPVTGADFYPTVLDLIGEELKPSKHPDGVSFLPALRGEQMDDRPLIWHYPHYSNQGGRPSSVIRYGKWKLIHLYETDTQELYNLENDISELRNLASYYPERTEALKNKLFDYLEEVNAKYPRKDPQYDEELERAHLKRVEEKQMPNLERQRKRFLSPDFDPENNWWGSEVD